jgi:hypothetical protein
MLSSYYTDCFSFKFTAWKTLSLIDSNGSMPQVMHTKTPVLAVFISLLVLNTILLFKILKQKKA